MKLAEFKQLVQEEKDSEKIPFSEKEWEDFYIDLKRDIKWHIQKGAENIEIVITFPCLVNKGVLDLLTDYFHGFQVSREPPSENYGFGNKKNSSTVVRIKDSNTPDSDDKVIILRSFRPYGL